VCSQAASRLVEDPWAARRAAWAVACHSAGSPRTFQAGTVLPGARALARSRPACFAPPASTAVSSTLPEVMSRCTCTSARGQAHTLNLPLTKAKQPHALQGAESRHRDADWRTK